MTPEQIAELRSLLGSATDRGISPYARNVHHNKLADRLIWNGADGGDGDLHALLDAAAQLARLRERLERLRPLSEAATDAPWEQGLWHPDTITSPSRTVVDTSCSGMEGGGIESADDRAFVIAARNEIAAMLEDPKEAK